MTKLQKAFLDFNEAITLSGAKKQDLITSRDAIKDTVLKWFEDNHPECIPHFEVQGSFVMETTLMQLDNNEYDIDLGVYLTGFEYKSDTDYPVPQTVHNWINKATCDETKENNIDKMTCVRVSYQKGYHVDLPSYIEDGLGNIFLAHTRDGWIKSDPVEFTNWFINHVNTHGEQIRRLVKYIKAWKDYRKMPIASIGVTILVCNNYVPSIDEDYKSLYYTIKNINKALGLIFACNKPVKPYENIFEDYSDTRRQTIIDGLQDFENKLQNIIWGDDCETKKKNLLKLFGDRFKFPCDEEFEKTDKPGVLKSDGRSA